MSNRSDIGAIDANGMGGAIAADVAGIVISMVAIGMSIRGGQFHFIPLRAGMAGVTAGIAAAVTIGAVEQITVVA